MLSLVNNTENASGNLFPWLGQTVSFILNLKHWILEWPRKWSHIMNTLITHVSNYEHINYTHVSNDEHINYTCIQWWTYQIHMYQIMNISITHVSNYEHIKYTCIQLWTYQLHMYPIMNISIAHVSNINYTCKELFHLAPH